jgi:hypothetical protein
MMQLADMCIGAITRAERDREKQGRWKAGRNIVSSQRKFDLALYMAEYERGLLPPIRWIARAQMKKALSGDIAAGARMIAKLSQLQALLVVSQSILALVAVAAMVFGLKLQ